MAQLSLIPKPQNIIFQKSHFILSGKTEINCPPEFINLKYYLADQVKEFTGIAIPTQRPVGISILGPDFHDGWGTRNLIFKTIFLLYPA